MNRVAALLLSLTILGGLAPCGALAQRWGGDEYGGRQQDEARAAVRERQIMPLGEIIARISRRTPGQVLSTSAPMPQGDGRIIYRILWDARGRQLEYVVDARSGDIIAVNGN